jgi:copper(I)-binding protein
MKTNGMTEKFGFLAISFFAATIMLAACQGGPPQISIDGAKAELSPAVVGEAMVTMNITNKGGTDMLTGVKIDIPGAKAMLHLMQGERMVTADSVKIPAKGNVELKMGSSHIMIEDMPKTIKEGAQLNVTLIFQKSGEKQISMKLQGAAAMPMGHGHHM